LGSLIARPLAAAIEAEAIEDMDIMEGIDALDIMLDLASEATDLASETTDVTVVVARSCRGAAKAEAKSASWTNEDSILI